MFIFLEKFGLNRNLVYFPEAPEESSEDVTTHQEGTSAENIVQDRVDIGELSCVL